MADSDSDGAGRGVASFPRAVSLASLITSVIAVLAAVLYFVIAATILLQGGGVDAANIAIIWLPATVIVASAALLAVGGVRMWRKGEGHGLVIGGCALILVLAVVGSFSAELHNASLGVDVADDRRISSIFFFVAPAILVLALAVLTRGKVSASRTR